MHLLLTEIHPFPFWTQPELWSPSTPPCRATRRGNPPSDPSCSYTTFPYLIQPIYFKWNEALQSQMASLKQLVLHWMVYLLIGGRHSVTKQLNGHGALFIEFIYSYDNVKLQYLHAFQLQRYTPVLHRCTLSMAEHSNHHQHAIWHWDTLSHIFLLGSSHAMWQVIIVKNP